MIAAEGILTAKGGILSHAALVARQMGKVFGGELKTAPSEIISGIVSGDKAVHETGGFKGFIQLIK